MNLRRNHRSFVILRRVTRPRPTEMDGISAIQRLTSWIPSPPRRTARKARQSLRGLRRRQDFTGIGDIFRQHINCHAITKKLIFCMICNLLQSRHDKCHSPSATVRGSRLKTPWWRLYRVHKSRYRHHAVALRRRERQPQFLRIYSNTNTPDCTPGFICSISAVNP